MSRIWKFENIYWKWTEVLEGIQNNYNDDTELEIKFKQWTTCDRAEMIACTLPVDDFVQKLCI